jgi:hypothetical protein
MTSAYRTFYRLVKTDPPMVDHFESFAAQGRVPRTNDPEVLRLWSGISAFETAAQARRTARQRPYLGAFVAELRLPAEGVVRWEKTLGPGHYTLWGSAADLLASVATVEPV